MFILIFEQLVKMFFIMLLAILCYKIKLVNQEGNKTVSNLLLLVVNPFVIITTYQTDYRPELVRGLLISFGAAVICHLYPVQRAGSFCPLGSKLSCRNCEKP